MKDLLEFAGKEGGGTKRRKAAHDSFFSDVEGFPSLSEQLTSNNVLRLINHYLSVMS